MELWTPLSDPAMPFRHRAALASQLEPALDQAVHSLPARVGFAVRVGPARPPGELRIGDAPRPRLRVAWQVGHVHDAADDATLEHGDAIDARLGLREGALPGDVGVGHCHARANFQTGSLVALVSGNGDGPRNSLGTAAAIPGPARGQRQSLRSDLAQGSVGTRPLEGGLLNI